MNQQLIGRNHFASPSSARHKPVRQVEVPAQEENCNFADSGAQSGVSEALLACPNCTDKQRHGAEIRPVGAPTVTPPLGGADTSPEGQMASALVSAGIFASVAALSGAMTVTGLSFTADTVAKVAAATPVKAIRKPSYISRLPEMAAEDLDIARSVLVATSLPTTPGPLEALPAPSFTHTVAVEALRVRSGPRVSYPKLFSLKGGTQVTARQQRGSWVKIDAGQGRVGWVAAKLLRTSDAQ